MPWSHVRVHSSLRAEDAFARVTRWEDHAVPLTTVHRTTDGFTARTGVGPIGFDDPMRITAWDPPRRVAIEKYGRVVLGSAEIEVATVEDGSVVTWREELRVRGVPGLLDPVVRWAAGAMLRRILRRLLA